VLAVRANRVVSRPELIDAVWGTEPPASAEGGIYTYIAGLRRVLEPGRRRDRDRDRGRHESAEVLVSVGGGYMLRLEPGCLDAVAFEQGMARYRGLRVVGDVPAAEHVLTEALALWRGEAFAGVPGPFAEAERVRLGELRTAAIEEHADLLLAAGRSEVAAANLTALIAEYPLRERARALLMTALYRCGRQADALQVFQDARVRLAEELGIDPGPELTQVHQQVLKLDPALDGPAWRDPSVILSAPVAAPSAAPMAGAAPGLAAEQAPVPAQLPHEVAGFAGRNRELGRLHALLGEDAGDGAATGPGMPVVVIAGTAGVGKTALAVRFAREVAARFPDGQLYVNLRGFDPSGTPTEPGTALRGFLEALGIAGSQVPATLESQTGLFRSLLDGKRTLLLLDNARTASQVRLLLPGSPGCMVIVTSRDQLAGLVAAEGARLLPLDVLSQNEAAELLAARLGADRLNAEPTAAAELIRQSARLPLALSVASARAVTRPGITLAALVAELRDARVRLDPLEADDVATDLRAVFSWSLARLTEPAARMFRLLGAAPGPDASAPVAASLAGIPLAGARAALTELCRASLLTEDERGRFGCHDLLRAYAAEQALAVDGGAAIDAAQRRLLDHYVRTAYGASSSAYPARPKIVLPAPLPGVTPEHVTEYEDIVSWFQAEQKGLLAAVALAGERGAQDQESDVYAWQLASSCAPTLLRMGLWQDIAAALRTGLASVERLGDLVGEGQVRYELGQACLRLREFEEADRNLRRALEVLTIVGDWVSVGAVHHGMMLLYDEQGRFADALPHAQEALRLRTSFGDRASIAYAENSVGWICANLGRYDEALRHCEHALELHLESGARSGAADTLDSIGFAYLGLGDHQQAVVHYQQAVEIFREIGDPRGESASLTGLGEAHLALGDRDAARLSWEQALALGTRMPGANSAHLRERLASIVGK
jgi:DNA-binding SARP family transcriptional activator/Flp pilus assembly protein TadD